jgi:phenylacetate-CoA ligase
VSVGLEQPDVAAHVTGKFVLEIATSADENTELRLTIELALNALPTPELERELARSVRAALESTNSEFLAYVPSERRTPRVRLLPLGEPEYFPSGVKHRYTRTV